MADYNVADGFARAFPARARTLCGDTHLTRLAIRSGLTGVWQLGDPHLGDAVRTARSSWVRRHTIDSEDYYIKTYVYVTRSERIRAALRWTGPHRPSRAAREAAALTWLRAHRFAAPDAIGVVENRRLGWLHGAILVTAAWPGQDLETLLARATPTDRRRLAGALGHLLHRLHRAGFRDGNFDLRNVLARRSGDGWELAKIDSPRFALVAPGRIDDRPARADWSRLLPQLQPFGLVEAARAGAATDPAAS